MYDIVVGSVSLSEKFSEQLTLCDCRYFWCMHNEGKFTLHTIGLFRECYNLNLPPSSLHFPRHLAFHALHKIFLCGSGRERKHARAKENFHFLCVCKNNNNEAS
jgi:hypothetical protein